MATASPLRVAGAALFAFALLLWSGTAAAADQLAAINPAQLFGTAELHSSNLKMFPKWRGMLRLFENELKTCGPDQCRKTEWQAIVERLRGKDIMTQLREINTEMNKRPYITDQVNWNLPDYWATPLQFLQKGGDCEDFAIAKYMALRAVGVPVEDMRIVVLNDLNLGIAHAVLAVYVNANPYILDNQISKVVPASTIRHYQPVYSINENGWWLHRNSGSNQFVGNNTGREGKTEKTL
ncbi:MAG TPA: transglutaminase-like cysteine peptidase [Candidatus Angelobacter sp.]|nr:transglutaminase-like cysteine peptidase [Candidatus Angelobacter sp.]